MMVRACHFQIFKSVESEPQNHSSVRTFNIFFWYIGQFELYLLGKHYTHNKYYRQSKWNGKHAYLSIYRITPLHPVKLSKLVVGTSSKAKTQSIMSTDVIFNFVPHSSVLEYLGSLYCNVFQSIFLSFDVPPRRDEFSTALLCKYGRVSSTGP